MSDFNHASLKRKKRAGEFWLGSLEKIAHTPNMDILVKLLTPKQRKKLVKRIKEQRGKQ